jgi:hypothetical protein
LLRRLPTVRADRVRYDPRTGDVLALGTVDTQIAGRRVRAEKLRYCAETGRLELANLLVEGLPNGGENAVYTRARGNGAGGVATPRPPCLPASSRLGVPWLAAATAEAEQNLSRIRGHDGVRLGAGTIVIEGRAFDLDPEARTLEVVEPDVRLRAPRARIEARLLAAKVVASNEVRIALEGAVRASVELPFPLATHRTTRVAASGDSLRARPRTRGGVDFVLEGDPARLSIQGASLEFEAPKISGRIRGRSIVVEGDLRGLLELVASAFPERRAVRRTWRVVSARRIELAPATTRPSWWFGGPEASRLPRRVSLSGVVVDGDSEPRAELVLFRPTWLTGPRTTPG